VKPETPAALSVEPPTQVSADLPPPISVDPLAPISVDPPAPISVDPPIPVLIEPISLDPPAPVSVEPPTTAPASKPKAKRREKKPKASPSNESASAGKKRKGDFNDAGRKKRALSKATIDNSDEETGPPVIETTSMPTSQVYVDIVTKSSSQSRPRADEPKPPAKQPLAQSQPDVIKPKPRSQSRSQGGAKIMPPRATPTTEERRQNQEAAILRGTYRLAEKPCDTCIRRLDRVIVPCAEVANGEVGSCFTCKLGKVTCSFVKDLTMVDGEIKIVWKKIKKPRRKQDVKMADVFEGGKEEPVFDVEMTEVGQNMGKGRDMVQSKGMQGNDVEMTEVTLKSEPEVGIIDKGKGRATPAIIVEPPTPVKVLTDVGPDTLQGKHQIQLSFFSLTLLIGFDFPYKFALGADQREMFVDPTPADDNRSEPGSSKPTPVDNHAQPPRPVLNSRRVSPPQPNEVHRKLIVFLPTLLFT
jgi:hypothetical protein